uniref:Amino acid permease/ SLC12A domain-containing protein n=1 Tax=Globisporangium ultimum (strain ATCC 200006 / CBS 805.95 / DAOM BR144) TaxID=431595 RepID=K3WA61_GLOUD
MTDTQTPVASHRFAKAPHLWALGVGAVISGDFFGWQSALIAGFDGLLVTLSIVTVLYVLLSFSIAELSTTLPAGGGPYVFALHGIGRPAAFFAGLAESLKVIITCAVVVTGIGSYLNSLLDLDSDYGPLWWCVFYVLFVVLNVVGIELSFRIQLFTTVLSVILLLVGAQSNDFLASVIGAIVFFALGGVYYFHSVKPYLGAAKAIRDPLLSSSDVAHKI